MRKSVAAARSIGNRVTSGHRNILPTANFKAIPRGLQYRYHRRPSLLAQKVALSLRDRKAESPNSVDEKFGCPVAERQGDFCGFAAIQVRFEPLISRRELREMIHRNVASFLFRVASRKSQNLSYA
jgi:hypothetical protein